MTHAASHIPSAGSGNSGRRAFTLIELILILAILAICAALIAPKLSGSTRARGLSNTATDFVSMTRWCRVQAISDGLHYRLNLDATEGRWWVTKDDGSGQNFQQVEVRMGEEYKLPDGVSMEPAIPAVDGEVYIDFGPGGRMDVGSVVFLYDENKIEIKCVSPLGGYHFVDDRPRNGVPQ